MSIFIIIDSNNQHRCYQIPDRNHNNHRNSVDTLNCILDF